MTMIMNREQVEEIIKENVTFSNVVGDIEEVRFNDGSFGTVQWLDSDGEEILVKSFAGDFSA